MKMYVKEMRLEVVVQDRSQYWRYSEYEKNKNQLDVTQCFKELVICSTCFGTLCPSSGARDYTVSMARGV